MTGLELVTGAAAIFAAVVIPTAWIMYVTMRYPDND